MSVVFYHTSFPLYIESQLSTGNSLKVDENFDHDALVFFRAKIQDRSIMVKTSAVFSFTFKLVPENCVSLMLQQLRSPTSSFSLCDCSV